MARESGNVVGYYGYSPLALAVRLSRYHIEVEMVLDTKHVLLSWPSMETRYQ